jgi:hypothetical protein
MTAALAHQLTAMGLQVLQEALSLHTAILISV